MWTKFRGAPKEKLYTCGFIQLEIETCKQIDPKNFHSTCKSSLKHVCKAFGNRKTGELSQA